MSILAIGLFTMLVLPSTPHFWKFAPTPPMGWNSWDCFATTVTEAQTKAAADVMASKLKEFGWKYVVVDIQWYEPKAESYEYRKDAHLVTDGYGRVLPATNRFPTAKDGAGFAPLASYVHGLGLKFGVHLMRGIPKQVVEENLPILGTHLHAQDIVDRTSTCPWNPDNYGVDMTKPGAQAYYDSVFQLLAQWHVDYVKVDDIARPYHRAEIEAVRKAIDKTGRKMVLSLSPGETSLDAADHVARNANLWRISDDFWDSWPALVEQFERCRKWSAVTGPGHFPDADMLPLGYIRFGERTRFTPEEQRTMMSLWAMVQSPLMLGCDLTKLDDWTLSLITNKDVIRVNQHSHGAVQLSREGEHVIWLSESEKGNEMFVGFFNLGDKPATITTSLKSIGLSDGVATDLWFHQPVPIIGDQLSMEVPPHGSRLLAVKALITK